MMQGTSEWFMKGPTSLNVLRSMWCRWLSWEIQAQEFAYSIYSARSRFSWQILYNLAGKPDCKLFNSPVSLSIGNQSTSIKYVSV